jgi:hypothetical protein
MDYFSQEYVDRLVAEHRLVVATKDRITSAHRTHLMSGDGLKAATSMDAISKLQSEQVVLETKIDILREFLTS